MRVTRNLTVYRILSRYLLSVGLWRVNNAVYRVYSTDTPFTGVAYLARRLIPCFPVLILLFICNNALAELSKIESTHAAGVSIYVDLNKIRHRGAEKVKMRHVIDYQNEETDHHGHKYLSRKELVEYNCVEEHFRGLASSMHTAHMGKGKTTGFISDARQWQPVESGTPEESLWKVACNKKSITQHD